MDFYGRYRDDIRVLWNGTVEEFEAKVLSKINNIDSNMQFTLEQSGKKVHYLCDEIQILESEDPDEDDELIVNLWAKKTNKFGYLTGDSTHYPSQKHSVIDSIGSLIRMVSDDIFLDDNLKKYALRLYRRDHDLNLILKKFNKYRNMTKEESLKMNKNGNIYYDSKFYDYLMKNMYNNDIAYLNNTDVYRWMYSSSF